MAADLASSPHFAPSAKPIDLRLIGLLFVLLCGFHLWAVTVGWTNGNLPGVEFRQAQTAISAYYIQKDGNFSLAYPTPVLGKPWSVPMEFPLYQWTVVGLSNLLKIDLTSAGRAVSVLFFYLSFPILFRLLGHLGLDRAKRLIVLSFVLTCPLYIFYARAFLIETMALFFSLLYLLGLLESVPSKKIGWLLVAVLAGSGAGLVKVTTFLLFLLPAFVLCIYWLWGSRPSSIQGNWRPFARTLGWLVVLHALPFAASWSWVHYADSIKGLNPAGSMLSSAKLAGFNFGVGLRGNSEIWLRHADTILHQIARPAVLVASLIIAVFFSRRWWRQIAVCLGLFVTVHLIFPGLYAWHPYYYVASAVLLLVAIGFALLGMFESRSLPRGMALCVLVTLNFAQIAGYLDRFYPVQKVVTNGVTGLSAALRDYTQPDDVLIIAGDDWSSITPYFSQRRALMLYHGMERNETYIRELFTKLAGERVTCLLLTGDQRDNDLVRQLAKEYFDIEPLPTLVWRDQVVYFHNQLRGEVIARYHKGEHVDLELAPEASQRSAVLAGRVYAMDQVWPRFRPEFRLIHPLPVRFYFFAGPGVWEDAAHPLRFSVHPETKLWFRLPAGEHRLRTTLELVPASYLDLLYEQATDGVELIATEVSRSGVRREVGRYYLNPRDNPADRSTQPIDWRFTLGEDSELELAVTTGPHGSSRLDWAALGELTIQ